VCPKGPSKSCLEKSEGQFFHVNVIDVVVLLRHSYDVKITCGICGGPCGVIDGIDLFYVVDVGGLHKNMKNRQVGPLKYEEVPRKFLLDPKIMKE
jgi:hypothetical protein